MMVNCPHCGGEVKAELADRPEVVVCPHCGEPMELPAAQVKVEEDLDGNRIRQISAIKRSAYRTRSYFLIGAVLCLAGFGQFAWNAVGTLQTGTRGMRYPLAGLWAIASAACGVGVWWMLRRADHYKREGDRSSLAEPEHPPDFGPLSDGSHAWKNLESLNPDPEISSRKSKNENE